jgi:hypothetical protein
MKRLTNWIYLSFFLAIWVVMLSFLYEKGKLPGGLIYGQIPQQTIDYFTKLVDVLDISIKYKPEIRPRDWRDKWNYGEDPRTGLKKIEDEYFIVYFNDSEKEMDHAGKIISMAHDAIPYLADMMGRYFYPEDVNQRKLPIYVTDSKDQFAEVSRIISENDRLNSDNVLGWYSCTYSRMGNLTKGITLSPGIWQTDSLARKVLWHEMNHYVYFTSLHYDKVVRPYVWVSEGLADYFSSPGRPLTEEQIKRCLTYTLSKNFPDFSANYWGGESVYRFMEATYQPNAVKAFIQNTYTETIENSIENIFHKNISVFEAEWKQAIQPF